MLGFARSTLTLALAAALLACAGSPRPAEVGPLASLSNVDSVTVLIHLDHPCAGISRENLEHEVFGALRRAGLGVSQGHPPYLHVRAYARAGVPTTSDPDTPLDPPASWHFGMWIDQSRDYRLDWGPLSNPCPGESILWSKGGTGKIDEGTLHEFIQLSLTEFVEYFRAVNP